MTRFVAFLRAINVGGHTVKMDQLRQLFESFGFSKVESFIASGNMVFESASRNSLGLENKIEKGLHAALGFHAAAFIRTDVELAEIASFQPFPQSELENARALNIAFLKAPLDDQLTQKIQALITDIDEFHVRHREVYWLCRTLQSDSTFSNAILEKTLAGKSTLRGASTIQKMTAKYAPGKP
jgi:uncharacterized protein (DUF1697 family)